MMTMEDFVELTELFESTVWPAVTGVMGEPVLTVPGANKIWIAITAIPTKYSPAQGSPAPRNMMYHVNTADLQGEFNARDIFYLNVHALYYHPNILVHGLQMRRWNLANGLAALIRYSNNPNEDPWLVRAMAEVAQYEAFGFTASAPTKTYGHIMIVKEFEKSPGVEIINPQSGVVSNDYPASRGQGFLFLMYLTERAGSEILQRMAQSDEAGMLNVALAVDPSAAPETAIQEKLVPLYRDWLVCNLNHRLRSDYAGGIYHYDFLIGTDMENFGHATQIAGFAGRFSSYPVPGTLVQPSFAIQAPIWAAQYCFFRSLAGGEPPVFFNGMYSDGSGGESAINGRWEATVVTVEGSGATETDIISVANVPLSDFYNGSFPLTGGATYLILTSNNPGGASNLRFYLGQEPPPLNLEVAVHQNQVSDNFAHAYAVPVNPETLEMKGFDWVGPILSVTRGSTTTPVKMEKFYGNMMWRGNINITSDGLYTLNFSGFDSTGIGMSNSLEMAVGTAGGKLQLQVRGILLDVPEGGAPAGSRVVLTETGMLGLDLGAGNNLAHASEMLTGVVAGPVSIPSVNGTLSFPAQNSDASIYRYAPDGWVKLDSYFQNGRIAAPVTDGGIYILGEAPGVSSPTLPAQVELSGNYPNPFSAQTVIRFATPAQGHVTMRVFDLSGRLVRTLANEEMAAANHSIIWDGTDANGRPLGAGIYFCRLEVQGQVLTQKIMMVE